MANNYGMIRVEPVPHTAVAGKAIHHVRDYTEDRPAPDHIDPKLEKHNIYVGKEGEPLRKRERFGQIMDRVKEAKDLHKQQTGRAVRKDANPVADLIFIRSDLEPGDEKKFNDKQWFKDTVEWAGERFGKENILGGALHMDEPDKLTGKIHPHIHVMIVPRETGKPGISFDRVFRPGTYSNLQTEYYQAVGKNHGLIRGKKREIALKHEPTKKFRGRKEKQYQKFLKLADKDPMKALEFAKIIVKDASAGLASQEVMEERITEIVERRFREKEIDYKVQLSGKDDTIRQYQEYAESLKKHTAIAVREATQGMGVDQAKLAAAQRRVGELQEENKKLSGDLDKALHQLDVVDEVMAFGTDARQKKLKERCTEIVKESGKKFHKVLPDREVRPNFRELKDMSMGRG